MWFPYPSKKEVDIFWPPPARWGPTENRETADLFSYLHYGHDTPLIEPDPNSFYVAFLLESETFGVKQVTLTEEQFQQCEFVSLHSLYNKEGHGFVGKIKPKPRTLDLSRNNGILERVIELGRRYNQESSSKDNTVLTRSLQLAYQINTLLFTSAWMEGIALTDSLLKTETRLRNITSEDCTVLDSSTPEWLQDPCCNKDLLIKECCLPRTLTQV